MISEKILRDRKAISRTIAIVIVIVIILVISGAVGVLLSSNNSTSPTTQTSNSSSSTSETTGTSSVATSNTQSTTGPTTTSTSNQAPTTFTWETINTITQLDPDVAWYPFSQNVLQNVYETLLWYNGSSGTDVIPWLAKSYTLSSDGLTANFTLRSGISFADGEPVNSTAVYFSLNRLLIEDNSAPSSFGSQASWIVQQLLNTSLSYNLGGPHNYTQQWAKQVLAENFVQVTGPLTFTLHMQHANAAFPYLLEYTDHYQP